MNINNTLRDSLNSQQLVAARHIDGPLLILAGAGSGKTRVVTYRTLYLINQGVDPKKILLITFTNKAANEMRERIERLDNKETVKGMIISTFHSLCVRILSVDIDRLGYNGKFSIYNSADQKQLYVEVYRGLKISPNDLPAEEIRNQISLAKNQLISPSDYPEKTALEKIVKIIYSKYQDNLKAFNALDFDDLLYLTAELFKKFPEVLLKYQRKFQYVLVDEYQDTNKAQYFIAKSLAKEHQNICVVGDDDQSIYSWRGADVSNILNFEKDFSNTKIILLKENYRSTGNILMAANELIANNENRKEKNLQSVIGQGELIRTLESVNPWVEAENIAHEIQINRISKQRNYNQYCILFRTNTQSKPFENAFNRLNIPYRLKSRFDFYDRTEIKNALAYLKIINNTDDDLSLLRIINVPRRNLGDKTIQKVKKLALLENSSIFSVIAGNVESNFFNSTVQTEIKHFVDMICKYQTALNSSKMGELFKEFLTNIGFYDFLLQNEDIEKANKRIKRLEQFISVIDNYASQKKNPSVKSFLTKLTLFLTSEGEEEKEMQENAVNLLTIHSSKGLEFPYVYIAGFEEDILPFRKEEEEQNIIEERRLAYVAMTRSQRELTLSLCQSRNRLGNNYNITPSRFLEEIPSQYIQRNYGEYKDHSKKDSD